MCQLLFVFVVCCSLFAVGWALVAVCCVPFVVLLIAVCCLGVFAVRCVLRVVTGVSEVDVCCASVTVVRCRCLVAVVCYVLFVIVLRLCLTSCVLLDAVWSLCC